jgi:hypothetical protein
MKFKDQSLLEQAYDSIQQKRITEGWYDTGPEEARAYNPDVTEKGYDTGPEEARAYNPWADEEGPLHPSIAAKAIHPAIVKTFNRLMMSIEDCVEDLPPQLLDKVIVRLQKAKKTWNSQ